ncbi:MAG: hypothetical protein A2504_15530 [Bdellovibrionales bacterium RIFOXYD12_FULL_39_22]|nr:MAG: hypothetical protein A2385_02960 [Bdellovibrionales bacterium RIFOXYB1_FULL_39_21]OFZ43204.1 MAG: hypothetical protein A2485_12105 [Bdellovibrionales bacterium RIFOXYC12_FULL_39_17]OFZ47942.1 MAG: hypothetical protein A2404_16745 [Bdellovibrionales bacterium RIFOXYC1_FULL_39_130]OFZ71652.1 MAG: hypothetical protein A2451_11060 [Bdellovibrionales bacterium RIFOXYC2_FULL_39_8]OFZ75722.1 MAG: hypothetical protein A2560_13245 [Bdellovibrionales bacterium RIFOXYD1_FULL_39_84]OFZ94212.1 MAG:
MSNKPINCLKCNYFYVTWDQNNPKGCRIYGFKSRLLPSILVAKESGKDCLSFEAKFESSEEKNDDIDLNDDSLW